VLEHRAFACAVVAYDPERFASADLERDVIERPEIALSGALRVRAAKHSTRQAGQQVAQRIEALAEGEALGHMLEADG
jgi:hypothetical protein